MSDALNNYEGRVLKQTRLTEEEEEKIHVTNTITLHNAQVWGFKLLSLMDGHLTPIEIVGSIRRQKNVCKDIDLIGVGTVEEFRNAVDNVIGLLDGKVKVFGDQIARILVPIADDKDVYIQADIYRATTENYGILKLIRTGSAEHNIWLARLALSRGMKLKYSVGLVSADKDVTVGHDEKAIFEKLKLPYINPTEREIIKGKPAWMK